VDIFIQHKDGSTEKKKTAKLNVAETEMLLKLFLHSANFSNLPTRLSQRIPGNSRANIVDNS